ncbi:hypothetical protein FRB97_003054, partial [Tulasnella sp. 331]
GYQITDVNFRKSIYMREAGPQLLEPVNDLNPLVDVGTMALYLADDGGSDNLLGLSCRHVLIEPKEANVVYVSHPSTPSKDVLLLGKRASTNLVDSIKLRVGRHGIAAKRWGKQIEGFEERGKGINAADVERAKAARMETQGLLDKAEKAMEALGILLDQVNKDWKKLSKRILGHILRSPPIRLGVGEQRFTEDWGIFRIDWAKLGNGFQGNKTDLGTKLSSDESTIKCFLRGHGNWEFKYPEDRLLPLAGIITDDLMRAPKCGT